MDRSLYSVCVGSQSARSWWSKELGWSFLEVFQLLSKKLLQFSFRTEDTWALKHTFRGYSCSVICCWFLQLSVVMLSALHTEFGEGYRPLSPEELSGFFDQMFLTFVLLKRQTLSKDFWSICLNKSPQITSGYLCTHPAASECQPQIKRLKVMACPQDLTIWKGFIFEACSVLIIWVSIM